MSLNYPGQEEEFALGSLATAATLTAAYTGNASIPLQVEHFAQLTFCVEYKTGTDGAGSSIQIKMEGSPDKLDNGSVTPLYYQETASLTVGGTITHTAAEHTLVGAAAATTYKFYFYAPPAFMTIKISAKETRAAVAFGTVKIRLITSGK